MKFLLLSQYFWPEIGASQIRLAALSQQLQSVGHEVQVVTAMPHHLIGDVFPHYRRRFYMEESYQGATVRRSWVYAATGTGGRRLFNYLSFAATSLIPLLKSQRPDVVFVESPPLFLGLSGSAYGSLRRVPFILHVADLWPESVRELGVISDGTVYRAAQNLERWLYRKASYVSAPTQSILNALSTAGVPARKLLFFPNGVDTEFFFPRPKDTMLTKDLGLDDVDIFLYAGTHGVAQGLDVILDAAELLKGERVAFLLVGDGHTKPRLIERAKKAGLRNVIFVDSKPLEQMPTYFSIATASIVPLLKRELFKGARPSKILPSLASGVPVIFCGEGETADLLRLSGSGVSVEPENAARLADAVLELSRNSERRNNMAAKGRQLTVERFSWNRIVNGFLDQLLRSAASDGEASL